MKKLILALLMCLPMTALAQKFGHIDSQAFLATVPEYIAAQNTLQAKAKELDAQLAELQKEIQTKYEDYQKNESTMTETKKKETEATLDELMQKFQQSQQDSQKQLQEEQQKLIAPIYEKYQKALDEVAKAGGYVYIMEKSALLCLNTALSKDVQSEVKAAYDKLK